MPTTTASANESSADTFSAYFRSLKLLNYVQKRLPRWALADQQIGTMDEDERQMKTRAEGTGLDPHQYATLLSAYLEAEPPESPGKFDWRNIEEFLTTPPKPNPLRQFISDHVARLYDEIGKLPAGIEKARASVRGVVRSGFGGYHDEVYEAYSLLKDEIPKEEIQAVIASWRGERQRFEKNLQYPSGLNSPKVPYHASPMMLDDRFSRWVRSVQAHNRLTLGWIRTYEPEPERHIHAVLVAAAPLDCFHAAMIWREQIALRYPKAAMVEPYEYGIGGLAYGLKSLDKDFEDVRFSPNLSGFVQGRAARSFGSHSAERRQFRRIQHQLRSQRQTDRGAKFTQAQANNSGE